jgi:endonuclease III
MSLQAAVDTLYRFYEPLPRPPRDPFAYFLWEVLSAETVPAKRDAAFAAFKKIPALTPDALWRTPQARIEAAVALAGPYREQRLQALRTGVDRFRRTAGLAAAISGPLRGAWRALRSLPHPGEVTARRMLLFTSNHWVFPVDLPVARVAERLGYSSSTGDLRRRARAVRQALRPELPADVDALRWTFLYLSHHGSATCVERDPHCSVCPLDCPYGRRATRP